MIQQRAIGSVVSGLVIVLGLGATDCKKKPSAEEQAASAASASAADAQAMVFASKAIAEDTPSGQWVRGVRKVMGDKLCNSGSYFRECFTVTDAECRSLMLKHFDLCLSKPGAIPTVVNGDTGRASGQIIGSCAGTAYELELDAAGKATKTSRCQDPKNWVP